MSEAEYLEQKVKAQGARFCEVAIGKPFTVRTAKATRTSSGSTVTGVIEAATVKGVRWSGRSVRAQFSVTLRRPDNSTSTHVVEGLPR